MADYSELMKLERKVKQSSLSPGQTGQRDVAGLPASTQAGKQTTQQASLHANLQTSKDTSTQADKPASTQAGKQVSLQTGKQVFIEKYSSYLTHEYKRELKRIAWESDRNEYEVLIEAVEQFLEKQKQSQ